MPSLTRSIAVPGGRRRRHPDAAAVPGARHVVIPDVAHMVGMEAPERLARLLADLVRPPGTWA